jgi:hypothetical protein
VRGLGFKSTASAVYHTFVVIFKSSAGFLPKLRGDQVKLQEDSILIKKSGFIGVIK